MPNQEVIYLNLSLSNLNNEYWVDITGYKGYYMVSNMGRIKSLSRPIYNGAMSRDRIIKQTLDRDGYLRFNLNKNRKVKNCLVHRVVANEFIPNPNNYPEVNHIKGIKTDNRTTELEWNTSKQNSIHSVSFGFHLQSDRKPKLEKKKRKIEDTAGVFKIYAIHCPTTNLVKYIGATKKTLKRRLRIHFTNKNNTQIHEWVKNEFSKNRIPKISLLLTADTQDSMYEKEMECIRIFKDLGYDLLNISNGGRGTSGVGNFQGKKHTKETINHLRRINIGRKHTQETKDKLSKFFTGFKHTDETKKKMTQSRIGRKHSDETKKKMSLSQVGNKNWLGKTHSEETKIKQSKNSARKIKLVQFDLEGVYIKTWDSSLNACKTLGMNNSTFSKYVNRVGIKKYKGNLWSKDEKITNKYKL